MTASAGTPWDDVVARAADEGWVGIEALAGIPGSVGATPVQNVGAYGQEVADVIASVRTWDRAEARVRALRSRRVPVRVPSLAAQGLDEGGGPGRQGLAPDAAIRRPRRLVPD